MNRERDERERETARGTRTTMEDGKSVWVLKLRAERNMLHSAVTLNADVIYEMIFY